MLYRRFVSVHHHSLEDLKRIFENCEIRLWCKNYIYKVVTGKVGLVGEAARAINVDAVTPSHFIVSKGIQRSIGIARSEVGTVEGKVAGIGVVGSYIDGIGSNRDRCGKGNRLPAGSSLSCKGGLCQQHTTIRPQVPDVGASVGTPFIEAQAGDISVHIGAEFDPKLEGIGITHGSNRRQSGVAP